MKGIQHILLADDDSDDCLFFTRALKELSVQARLTSVNNGEDLLEFLNNNGLPDVIFLDVNMPRKNGLETMREISINAHLRSLPVIAISTAFDSKTIEQLYKLGICHFFRKPNEFESLKIAITESLALAVQVNAGTSAK